MPFVTPKGGSNTTTTGAAGRSTFRPPWVKDDVATTSKPTTVPWAKKTPTTAEKENGEKSTTIAKKPTTTTAKAAEPAKTTTIKKTIEPAKKVVEPPKKIVAPVKKAPEPTIVKKPASTIIAQTISMTPTRKKEPTPPSSSEEEETETEEEETEEESEDDGEEEASFSLSDISEPINQPFKDGPVLKPVPKTPAPKEKESDRRFSIEKPKLRPVTVIKEKPIRKIEDDDEYFEDETEEERERRLRFKLEKPKLRHVKREEKPLPSNKSTENILKIRPALKKVPRVDEVLKPPKEEPKPEFKTKTLRKAPSIRRESNIESVPAPPPLPSLVPKAPPPPGGAKSDKPLSSNAKETLDKLRSRPRRRPDWSEMMKEVESGRKLRHVQCNDRSQPILTCKSMTKVDDKFIYETEKDNSHNKLLKQIQGGIRLKPTQTNDRSKPFIDGLRKFRRQMTIEEQLQKSQSKVNMLGETPSAKDGASAAGKTGGIVTALSIDDPSGDELDDIDKIRDDLQSTKQMLALELRNREAQERENKKLLAKIATLEAELEREKSREKNLEYGSNVIIATMDAAPMSEQIYLQSLKQEVDDARKVSKELEKKYLDTGELYDQAKIEIEEQKRQIQILERKLAQALHGNMTPNAQRTQFNFCYAYEDPDDNETFYGNINGNAYNNNNFSDQKGGSSLNGSRRSSDVHTGRDSSPDFDLALSESDPDEPEEKKAERREKRLVKEIKVLRSKLTKTKVKEEAAKKEKQALKQAMKKNHVILKEENKKFKKLEKEVQKMAASMREQDVDDEKDDDEDEDAEEAEEEESEESEESESEESEAETESESEAEDASNADKKQNLEPRVKKHEGRFSALKKCNVLLQANVDNLQDEISQVRARAANLQSELDAVLADLGL